MQPELDLLGTQLLLTVQFRDSGFDPNLKLNDDVCNEMIVADKLFLREGDRWFMRGQSIPGHLGVKAIAVDDDSLYLETSPLDAEAMRGAVIERMLPIEYAKDENSFVDMTTGKILIVLGPPTQPEIKELGIRRLWTLQLKELHEVRRMAAIRIMDLAYSVEAYEVEKTDIEVGRVMSQAAVQKIQLQIQLGLQQQLRMEQRPMLSLSTKQQFEGRPEQNMELRQIMALNFRITRMDTADLIQFFAEYLDRHGEKAALQVAIFALAGKVKQAMPKLSWREARNLARKLVTRAA